MYYTFTAGDHDFMVRSNGATMRWAKDPNAGSAETLRLTPTERRIMRELVQAPNGSIRDEDLADVCLEGKGSPSDDRLELLYAHAKGLRKSLECRNLVCRRTLVRRRAHVGVEGERLYSLGAEVRRVDEAEDWGPMTSVTEDAAPIVNHVLIESQWFLPEARRSGTSVELNEIAIGRQDSQICIIGYDSGAFDMRSLHYFISEYEPSGSGLLEWAGVVNSDNLVYPVTEVDGTREFIAIETGPTDEFRMVMGATGARLKLVWEARPEPRKNTSGQDHSPTAFICGGNIYSIRDGTTDVEKHLKDGTKRILQLKPQSAQLLTLFLTRIGPVSNEEIWQSVWPEKKFIPSRPLLKRALAFFDGRVWAHKIHERLLRWDNDLDDANINRESAQTIRESLRRLRNDLELKKGVNIIVSAGAVGSYKLNAQLLVPLEGRGTLADGPAKMPIRLLLPGKFVLNGPGARATIRLRQIKAFGRDGMILTLGLAPDATLSSLQWLLNSKSRPGRLYLKWAGLDPQQPQRCTGYGNVCVVGDNENHLLVFAEDTLTATWVSQREPPPNSAMALLNQGE